MGITIWQSVGTPHFETGNCLGVCGPEAPHDPPSISINFINGGEVIRISQYKTPQAPQQGFQWIFGLGTAAPYPVIVNQKIAGTGQTRRNPVGAMRRKKQPVARILPHMGLPCSIVTRVAIAARNSAGGPARCFNTSMRVVIISSAVVDDVDLTGDPRRHHYLVVARVIIDDAAVRHISVHLGQIEFSDIDINTPGIILVAMHRAAKMILKAPLPNDIARWVYLHQFVRPQRFYAVANTLLRGA